MCETEEPQAYAMHLHLVYNGSKCHAQMEVIQLLRKSRVTFLGLPSHTSHVLQPLDVAVCRSYKLVLQREFHLFGRVKKQLQCFDTATVIMKIVSKSFILSNITNGFLRTGIWGLEKLSN